MRYLKTFVIAAPILGLVYHWAAVDPMAWWPDTVIMGVAMGAVAAFVLMRFRHARQSARHLRGAAASLWRLLWRPRR